MFSFKLTRAFHVANIERRHHARITGPLITELKHSIQAPDSGPLWLLLLKHGIIGFGKKRNVTTISFGV